jgi:hypothetical protein
MNVEAIRKESTSKLLNIPGVVGVGSPGKEIRVYVESLNPVEAELPAQIDGVPVVAFKTGKLYALSLLDFQTPWLYPESAVIPKAATEPQRVARQRPVIGGISIGHPEITAGTMGTSLDFMGLNFGVSNNHIFANSSTKQVPRASIGDPIIQPGSYDGGSLTDKVGTLKKYVPMDRIGFNRVDAALFEPSTSLSPDIYGASPFTGVAKPEVGQIMTKSGRTTGYTSAAIIDVDATVSVTYDEFEAKFEHQSVTDVMSGGGDSGSAGGIGTDFGGLLFAGSDVVTILNRPDMVIRELSLPSASPPLEASKPIIPLLGLGLLAYLASR